MTYFETYIQILLVLVLKGNKKDYTFTPTIIGQGIEVQTMCFGETPLLTGQVEEIGENRSDYFSASILDLKSIFTQVLVNFARF